jgi:SpoVK/Ycf46/Vps4 family AAA+-type ATPase
VTHGYVGADLESLVKEAALVALHRKIELQKKSPENQNITPRVCKEGVHYEDTDLFRKERKGDERKDTNTLIGIIS